ncbi:GlmL-related ornithine degradation protein [Proteiniclasticum sp. C24MP]|uniref:GlmL-related ornithine degradation protein n=1 Tax=Proteiniclasticum sp. C24MP TaxID=3374101 RepID=UPI003754191C
MKIDVLVAEIGSTTTVVNAFHNLESENPVFLGQGQGVTSVEEGDVTLGLQEAMEDLRMKLALEEITYDRFLATSSAAGGLRMTVHGLVHDMTVKASREAALGAGAIIRLVTSGRLKKSDLRKIMEINPNIIMIAGGLDHGERDTALYNAEKILEMGLTVPVIYAGNIDNRDDIEEIFDGYQGKLYVTDNVYPQVDVLQVEPARKIIQEVFEENIIHAKGMEKVHELVNGRILPTPGAVMESAKVLKEVLGDLMIIDVGGATTDVHSVTRGSEEISRILLSPEPEAKRTVEGDLGVYVNRKNLILRIGEEKICQELKIPGIDLHGLKPIPETSLEKEIIKRLTREAVFASVERHAGTVRNLYGESSGRKTVAEGKDLTEVKYIIGTGGALTRLENMDEILSDIHLQGRGQKLYPKKEAEVLLDTDYLLASLGVLSLQYKEAALKLMLKSLRIEGKGGGADVSVH